MTKNSDVIIVGGGAAGLYAANLLSSAATVTVIDKNEKPGRKLRITGKGRCNVTNDCDRETFFANVPVGSKFLYTAYSKCSPQDMMAFFEGLGVPLKVERGNRVFPVSDNANDIAGALVSHATRQGVNFVKDAVVKIEPGCVITATDTYTAPYILVATGGKSYPQTGSTGDGYDFAESLGHTIDPIRPSLIPVKVKENDVKNLQGLSLKNVTLSVTDLQNGKVVFSELGEMLFTHFGLSGPLVLSASAHLSDDPGRYRFDIDLKPALTEEVLDKRILRDFDEFKNKNIHNGLVKLLPGKMIGTFVTRCGLQKDLKVNTVSRAQRKTMVDTLKRFSFTFDGLRGIEEAIVTRGGINLKQINPKNMESKLAAGIYFVGEVLNIDGYTGGFNLQIAFSTAHAAAQDILTKLQENQNV
ncbi:MAG: NAD(P)/FAD-dependent oxidoreductase [Oscillospiraceae bacterium]|nr:NAD(P)/FAD-dependent oxidoreductase [Oscillospiraceae bacterium]